MWRQIIWNEDRDGNVEHIEQHGITIEDVEHVLEHSPDENASHPSGLPCVFGYTPDGTYIIAVYELIDRDTIYPITA